MWTYYYGTSNCVIVPPGQLSVTVNCAAYYTTSSVYAYENISAGDNYYLRCLLHNCGMMFLLIL